MNPSSKPSRVRSSPKETGISQITLAGYKSIRRERSIEVRPLTLLAGSNSSGKSSMMQSLLLLKQTLEAPYDPGALKLDGPNVRFTSVDQFLSKRTDAFHIGIKVLPDAQVTLFFHNEAKNGIQVTRMISGQANRKTELHPDMSHEDLLSSMPIIEQIYNIFTQYDKIKRELTVKRNRFFLDITLKEGNESKGQLSVPVPDIALGTEDIESYIREIIHVPGLRGNPERTYPVTAVGSTFPGTFENYVASVIAHWQAAEDSQELIRLSQQLHDLGLTRTVTARRINDTQVELQVGRLPTNSDKGASELVNIADVGFGVSQTLPVLVALLAAQPGQLVYLEQPEIHLHPRAQAALAQILADAANRGVRVVAETHSELLLLGVQTLIAKGKITPDKVKLHWFQRDSTGTTKITSADLDESGRFGDWPEDFSEVGLRADSEYLDAAEQHLMMALHG